MWMARLQQEQTAWVDKPGAMVAMVVCGWMWQALTTCHRRSMPCVVEPVSLRLGRHAWGCLYDTGEPTCLHSRSTFLLCLPPKRLVTVMPQLAAAAIALVAASTVVRKRNHGSMVPVTAPRGVTVVVTTHPAATTAVCAALLTLTTA